MSEDSDHGIEGRARRLFDDSVENLDMRVRSRLTQARHAALAAAARPRLGFMGRSAWTGAAGFTAAGMLAAAVWFAAPMHQRPSPGAEARSNFEDLEIVASTEEGAGDEIEMLQDDIDFYAWAAEDGTGADGNSVG